MAETQRLTICFCHRRGVVKEEDKSPATSWEETLSELQLELSRATFNTWLHSAGLAPPGPGAFIIGVKTAYAKDWLTHCRTEPVRQALSKIAGRPMDVHFTVVNPAA